MSRRAHLIRKKRAMAAKLNALARKYGEPTGWVDHGSMGVAFHTKLGIFFTGEEADLRRAEERLKWKLGHAREEKRQFEVDCQRLEAERVLKERRKAEQEELRRILGKKAGIVNWKDARVKP